MAMNKVAMNDEEMDQVTGGSILPYAVQSGDTLAKIAKKYNVTMEQLIKWNAKGRCVFCTRGYRLTNRVTFV